MNLSIESLTAIVSFLFGFGTSLVVVSMFIARLASRTTQIEKHIEVLFRNDETHRLELKSLSKIEAQIELLIKHIIPTK
ncbi:MAG: hypothetical protein COT46_00200 [Sulfurimonas sp. CG08_land_8_20_14_0_20_36_33]|nr:hypothetical protein [Campylobacterota bacterium]OIO16917.1 MAG: hypothetical protein AUJ81_03230 [Helicobacteraceae bacterium CG1_02_36_14]PIP09373.1 MAG: hypothetical protein COX50_11380 [Sulfurimonas sp. CG23_combo_of_CG06-09_8_20_14_all_36_33]PIS27067.1 MAG: hypothetical protein COT46_00200 [Sulfurimonas sp. CG08_land_8_20_14_0_20_36_33]PIV05784.1 MAG: hypothetical protein COS56_00265 [Sulfurimonas sp. CG03_land_8_20_14_0_80_36_25]PIV61160.1 MAG: hypothetical protein COS13_03505 [Sulfur